MKMTNREYGKYIEEKSKTPAQISSLIRAFVSGGAICCIGQAILNGYMRAGITQENSAILTSVTLIFIGGLLTGLKVYDNIAKFAGAGSLVPITGFANSIVATAIEFKSEGIVTGLCAKMFIIAGPVIVFGITASVVYGFILMIVKFLV